MRRVRARVGGRVGIRVTASGMNGTMNGIIRVTASGMNGRVDLVLGLAAFTAPA